MPRVSCIEMWRYRVKHLLASGLTVSWATRLVFASILGSDSWRIGMQA